MVDPIGASREHAARLPSATGSGDVDAQDDKAKARVSARVDFMMAPDFPSTLPTNCRQRTLLRT
jgi:hypothetical protein